MNKLKYTLLIPLFLSLSASAQKEPKKDTATVATKQIALTDSTPIFSITDYQEFYKTIVSKMPTEQGLPIIDFWANVINRKILEFNKKK